MSEPRWDPADPLEISAEGGMLICGKSQWGKSNLIAVLLQTVTRPVLIIDPKQEPKMLALADHTLRRGAHWPDRKTIAAETARLGRGPRYRYVPRVKGPDGKRIRPGEDADLERLLSEALHQGYVLVVVDELPLVGNEHSWSATLQQIAQQGNGDPHHMGWWVLSQTALSIPKWARDQANIVISFWMGNADERRKLAERGVDWSAAADLDRHWFLAHQFGWRTPHKFPPVPEYTQQTA